MKCIRLWVSAHRLKIHFLFHFENVCNENYCFTAKQELSIGHVFSFNWEFECYFHFSPPVNQFAVERYLKHPLVLRTWSWKQLYLFSSAVERFRYSEKPVFIISQLQTLSAKAVLGSAVLGFSLSVLFFMDQNITSAMVNNPCNK
jgi:hypothetical protein